MVELTEQAKKMLSEDSHKDVIKGMHGSEIKRGLQSW